MKWNFLYQITAASRTPDYAPQIPVVSVLNWICWTPPPRTKFVCTPLGCDAVVTDVSKARSLFEGQALQDPGNVKALCQLQASAAKWLRTALFCVITQREVTVRYYHYTLRNNPEVRIVHESATSLRNPGNYIHPYTPADMNLQQHRCGSLVSGQKDVRHKY